MEYELAPTPPAIFNEISLRKGTKSSIVKVFEDGIVEHVDLQSGELVVDGGFLLHAVTWAENATYGTIIEQYIQHVLHHYGENVTIVFDGYPEVPTAKDEEQRRRSAKVGSCTVEFELHTKCFNKKEAFLSNKFNKKRLINKLAEKLNEKGFKTMICEADADTDIVKTAIQLNKTASKVVIVGTDTDLLILLIALAPEENSIFFCRDIRGKNPSRTFYNIRHLIQLNIDIKESLLFSHAMTGCDTTSAFYGLGKSKAIDLIKTNREARQSAEVFLRKDESEEVIKREGEKFVLKLYGMSAYSTLNEARYYKFTRLTSKSTLKTKFDLAKLPPTSEACVQHSLRSYHQIQQWLGNTLEVSHWGWRYETSVINGTKTKMLRPIPSLKPFAPEELLCLVSCACKSGCGTYCSCRKSSFQCTSMCHHCNGLSCMNIPQYEENREEEDDDEEELDF